jgi:hypothetical protein
MARVAVLVANQGSLVLSSKVCGGTEGVKNGGTNKLGS